MHVTNLVFPSVRRLDIVRTAHSCLDLKVRQTVVNQRQPKRFNDVDVFSITASSIFLEKLAYTKQR